MAWFPEQLRDWLARVEIVASGSEQHRSEAVRALAEGRAAEGRQHALAILAELPRSRVALALWADAAEALLLDGEAREALERLAAEVPFRADVWYRLAGVRRRLATSGVGEALERAVEAEEPQGAADAALVALAERDLDAGDPGRAERWLERASLAGRDLLEVRLRRAEALLDLGELDAAQQALRGAALPHVLDGRGWLLVGRLRAARDPVGATAAFVRSLLLGADAAEAVVTRFVEQAEPERVAQIRALVADLGLGARPAWRAAFAVAGGRAGEAVAALAAGVRESPEPTLLQRYARASVDARDPAGLRDAVAVARSRGESLGPGIAALDAALGAVEPGARLRALDGATGAGVAPWASALRRAAYAAWFPRDAPALWGAALGELDAVARGLGDLGAVGEIAGLARELEQPLRVAVVGEFNAGKSSFINALLGEEVAPVGVLPTTATVNRVVWAPDRFARVVLRDGSPDRVVAHGELRATLREVTPERVAEVVITAPLSPLRRIELHDTPGFNAPDPQHAHTARLALLDTHVAIWLLDASQPLKETERSLLQELQALEVPLVVLVNKTDRVEGDLAAVLAHVEQGLTAAGIACEAGPLGFSARLALEGRRGDPAALARSSFAAVEALVEGSLVARSAALRERALRRRARRLSAHLVAHVERLEAASAGDRRLAADARRRALGLVGAVRAARGELQALLEGEARRALEELARDAKPVQGGSPLGAAARFLVARTRRVVGRRLAEAALGYCETRLGDLPPAIRQELRERLELGAGVVAPWLIEEAGERVAERAGTAAESAAPSALRAVVFLAVDELCAAAERAVATVPEPRVDPVHVRIRDFDAAVTATAVSGGGGARGPHLREADA